MKYIRQPAIVLALILSSLFGTAGEAATITIDFSLGTAGIVTPQTFTDASGLTVDAWYLVGNAWTQTDLFRRNDNVNDAGFGVCSPGETLCGDGSGGGGDYNELSNNINSELIRLTLPDGYTWASVALSSADTNDGDAGSWERGQLWASGSALPSVTPGSLGGTVVWQITGGTPNQTIPGGLFTPSNNTSPFLFFEAYDWLNNDNTNNDYLIHSVTVQEPDDNTEQQVPEPTLLTLFSGGAAALWGARRRSRRPQPKAATAKHV